MKRSEKYIYIVLTISISFTVLLGYVMRQSYYNGRKEICKRMEIVFKEAIGRQMEIFSEKEQVVSFFSDFSDIIPAIERQYHCAHEYILQNFPERYSLDSLFRLKIAEHQIQARSAVRRISCFGVIDSSPDSLFYEQSVQLPPVIYRPRSGSGLQPVELQAYVQIPFLFILKQMPGVGFMILLWILVNGALWTAYFLWPWYKERMLAKNKIVEIQTVVEEKIVKVEVPKFIPVQSFTRKNVFPPDFLFDKNTGLITYNGKEVKLTKLHLKLFCYFLNMKQSVLSYEEIGKHLYNLNEIDTKEQSRISTTVARLRESLSPFPFIRIETVRSTGYQLYINPSEPPEGKA